MNEKKSKQWFKRCVGAIIGAVLAVIMLVYVFDPYFHFHRPFSFVRYRLYDERYTNDGISRHFDFDCIVTGTSMAQNFKTSEIDEIFKVKSVKETFAGSGYKELSDNLDRTLTRNKNCKTVIWSLDYNSIIRDKDWTQYTNYPEYLYDDNLFNDVSYIFNKDIFYHGMMTNIVMTLKREESTSFDEYSSWDKPTGRQYVLGSYERKKNDKTTIGDYKEKAVIDNIQQNVVDLVNKYPDVTFYIFYTPYSICFWDAINYEDSLENQFNAEQIATEMIVDCPNVKLYNFNNQYDTICNLDNYRDKEHYGAWINSQIVEWISENVGLINRDNYIERLEEEKEFYRNYDYDSIYE